MKIKKYSFLIFYCLLISCIKTTDPKFADRIRPTDIIHIDPSDSNPGIASPDSLIEIVKYIKPETSNSSLITSYSKVKSFSDTLFIFDKSISGQSIKAFNFNGDFLFKIDNQGYGPNEYQGIVDFYIDEQSKHIGILSRSQIYLYNFSGAFIKKINLRNYNIQKIECKGGRIYAWKCPSCISQNCFSLAVFDLDGRLIYEDYPVNKRILNYPFNKANYFSINSDGVYLNLLNSDTIYRVDEHHVSPVFALDFGKYSIPESDLNKLMSKDIDFATNFFKVHKYTFFGLSEFHITDEFLYFNYHIQNTSCFSFYSTNLIF